MIAKDLVFAVVGALLGTVFGYLVAGFSPASVFSWSLVVGLILASVAVLTEYILHTVSATVPGLPVGSFRTSESAASDAAVSEHYWEWRRI